MKLPYPAFPLSTTPPCALPTATGAGNPCQPDASVAEAPLYQHLHALLAQVPVAMYLLRGPTQMLDLVNQPAAAGWGRPADQVRGQPFFEALPDLRGQGYEAAYATVWQTQQVVTWWEAPVAVGQQPDESAAVPGYFNVTFQPFYEGPGCLTGILVTSHDVTEQVLTRQHLCHATAELAATNAGLADYVRELTHAAHAAQAHAESWATLLTQLLERVPLAIGLLVGADYVVEVCTPSLLARWGCTLAQVLHQPLFEVLPELQQGLQELLDEVIHTGVPAVAPQLPGPGESAFIYYPLRDAQGHTVAIAAVAAVHEHGQAPLAQPLHQIPPASTSWGRYV